jgi:hypothetical protein
LRTALLWVGVAVALTVVFWLPLWRGGGLIGGDVYTYYFPQKTFYAERLKAGEFPLWNSLWGHGYPLIAESQTGAFSPFNLVAYRLLDVNTAYNAVQLLHYVLAFVFTWMYARSIGLSTVAAAVAGLVYTYGWFPVRIVLEWAIVTGAWLPLALWCVEKFIATRHWRYLILLSIALAVQLLPGHFNLAFITLLVLVMYAPVRLWSLVGRGRVWRIQNSGDGRPIAKEDPAAGVFNFPRPTPGAAGLVLVSIGLGFALAAAQLLPTWELKQRSQRASVAGEHDPGYGHIPVWYWSQAVAPWMWYTPDLDLNSALPKGSPLTNPVEAHLYFGLVPLLLVAYGLWTRRAVHDRRLLLWLVFGIAALLYTPGWLLPLTKHLPGFSFFMGPGRYGIVTTLAVGLLAGAGLDELLAGRRVWTRLAIALVVLAVTTVDLRIVGETVRTNTGYAITETPIIEYREESVLREMLQSYPQPVRLFARGPNLPTLLGVASTPVYLGIGPEEYFDPETAMPAPLPIDRAPTAEHIDWLRRAGVTHVLSFEPLDPELWSVRPVWTGHDALLNRAWARREPLYLAELQGSRGRVTWLDDEGSAEVVEYAANHVVVEAESAAGGLLVLTDLAYPGWDVRVDGAPAEGRVLEGMYRGVQVPAGAHRVEWSYRPRSVWIGGIISAAAALTLAAIGHVRYWHPGGLRA